jgi:hypothetical protein
VVEVSELWEVNSKLVSWSVTFMKVKKLWFP